MLRRAPWRGGRGVACAVALLLSSSTALAQTVVPGPGESGYDAELAAKADAYDRLIHEIMTLEVGWGLEAFVDDPGSRAVIDGYFASSERDFETSTGSHPYEVVSRYGEYGDLGMFGGVQGAGDAFRYAVLRDSGAPTADVDQARQDLLRAMDGLHWYTRVTGEPGVVARGIRRAVPEEGDPPLPAPLPDTLPLFDASGDPQPADKEPTWRADQSGELPFLIWLDDCSKDQLDGYVFALGAVYDVVAEDDTIPRDRVDRLVADALALGRSLMVRRDVGATEEVDLVIVDADGRPTTFHDLSAEEVTAGSVLPGAPAVNGFNGWMALGIVRTLFHITGDETLGRFYYEELLDRRDYLASVEESISVMYFGEQTNYSNVNMAFVAAYGVLRYESDEEIGLRLRRILHDRLYAPGRDREARGLGQSLFDFLYAAFRVGPREAGRTAIAEGIATLRQFPDPPYWNPAVENCDDAEIAAMSCTAIDGATTIALSAELGRGDSVVAVDPLPKRLRPPSNFEWRSDPHAVNGGGGTRLNPGGGFHGAYWMGRFLEHGSSGFENVSPLAREAPPRSAPADAGAGVDGGTAADGGTASGDDGGCGCVAAGAPRSEAPAAWTLLLLLAFRALRTRRSASRRRGRRPRRRTGPSRSCR